jgi:thiamine pyrophosphokinase
MQAAVIANGDAPALELLREVCAAADVVYCADGGLRHAVDAGIRPDAVVGDLDSVTPEMRDVVPDTEFHEDRDADTTDLQKAVEYALERGAEVIDIVGAGGGRADHHLANLSVLTMYGRRARITIIDDLFDISLVDGTATVEAPAGTVVSLIALGECTGVTTTGMRWDLKDYRLHFSPYGVHNEVATSPATVSVVTGDLLLFRGRFIERHR